MQQKQSDLAPTAKPKLTVRKVAEKMSTVDREIKYLVNKAKINARKKLEEEAAAKIKAEEVGSGREKLMGAIGCVALERAVGDNEAVGPTPR